MAALSQSTAPNILTTPVDMNATSSPLLATASAPCLTKMSDRVTVKRTHDNDAVQPMAKRLNRGLSQQDVLVEAQIRCDHRSRIPANFHPHEVLLKMMLKKGVNAVSRSFEEMKEFFQSSTEDEVDSYGMDVLRAIRESDIEFLRDYHGQGKSLNISNRFGESVLHLACRKQLVSVVDFLLNVAHVPVQVCDDYGRTPMHDACWTSEPNFEVVDLILDKCPDLLLIKDKRGHTPLFYARREHWGNWLRHLGKNISHILPRNELMSEQCAYQQVIA